MNSAVRLSPPMNCRANDCIGQRILPSKSYPRISTTPRKMLRWPRVVGEEGELKYAERVVGGFENTPCAFMGWFTGENLGKHIIRMPKW